MDRIAVGPAAAFIQTGYTFTSSSSEDWPVGAIFTTWSGLQVTVTRRDTANTIGSWKYKYAFQVTAVPQRRAR